MARLTRDESKARNRELLLASARRLFLRDGYQATSLAAVAEDAGFSTGVVYSNFSGKAELGLLVLREIQAEQFASLHAAFEGDGPVTAKLDAFEKWAEDALDSGWGRLELEFALEARSEPTLIAAEAERHGSAAALAAEALAGLLPGRLLPMVPLDAAASALINIAIGVGVRRLIDPSVGYDEMIKPLRESLQSLRSPAS